jgi:hypothetical protein
VGRTFVGRGAPGRAPEPDRVEVGVYNPDVLRLEEVEEP